MIQKELVNKFRCSKCSKIMTLEDYKKHDCIGMRVNRRTIRLPSRYR